MTSINLAVCVVVPLFVLVAIWVLTAGVVRTDHVPRDRTRPRVLELGTVVVAKHLPDGSDTPRALAAPLLASRPARTEITRLGGGR